MTDKKFTQEEIVKALECCIKDDAKYCDDCSYYDEKEEHEQLCVYRLHRDTLDLIARLKARIVRYQLKNTNQRHTLAMLNKQVAEQKAEIEKLKSCNDVCVEAMGEQEIELATAKSEAIKEFAERLKNATVPITLGGKYRYDVISKEGINCIVKEMTEGGGSDA